MRTMQYATLVILALAAFSACKTEKEQMAEHHFGNKLYLNTEIASEEILVKLGMPDVVRSMSVSVPLPAEKEITGVLVADQAFVENYKTIYGDNDVQPLPYDNCYIENPQFTIPAGSTVSNSATVVFTDLSSLDHDVVYVMPVVLKNVTDLNVVGTKTEVYYVFRGADLINVVCDMRDNRAGAQTWATPDKFRNMTTFTWEALVRQHETKFISSIMGVEGHYLLRIGDSGLAGNQLQVASARGLTNSDMMLPVNQWNHIACVFDHGRTTVYINGRKVLADGDGGISAITINAHGGNTGEAGDPRPRYFWLGYSYEGDRDLWGDLSEVRIWERCLTEEEINTPGHFYFVEPSSPGLLAYWKMDEGKGLTLKDSSPNGNNLTLDKEATWERVALPETK